jgi:glycogen(starch) synthase
MCAYSRGRTVPREELLTKEDDIHIKRCIYNLQRTTLPPITTHNMVDDSKDPILNELRRCGVC